MTYYGQHGEDKYLHTFFQPGYKGVCVEVGAFDGIRLSNTYFFELLGWRALCIEPVGSAYEKCKRVRKEVVKCCIGQEDKAEPMALTVFHLPGENTCAITSLEPDERLVQSHQHLIQGQSVEHVPVRSLTSLMDEIGFPTVIDFVSIDTENTELDVLRGIDFQKYQIKYLVVENNYNEPFCEDFLRGMGYKKIHRIAVNDFYKKV